MRLSCFSIATVVTLVRADYFRDLPHRIKESIHGPPHGWVTHGPAPLDHLLRLKIALPQPHFPVLEKHLWEVSDPNHSRYGAYLSKEEAQALMAPHPEALEAVSKWLSSYGIKEEDLHRSSAKDWVTIHIPVSLAEKMLDTKYHVYTHSDNGGRIVRTTSYSLPENLHEHVELIQPTTMFYRPMALKSTVHWSDKRLSDSGPSNGTIIGPAGNPVDASCKDTITISCIRQLYNAVGYNTSATNVNKIAVAAYLEEYTNDEDLQQFYDLQNPAAHGSNYTFVSVNGGLNNQTKECAGIYANTHTQLTFGLTYPIPATFYSTGGLAPDFLPDEIQLENGNEPFADWIDYVSSQDFPPQTITTSGYVDDEQTVPYSYANRVCSGFAALGVRGVSLLFSTGDFGVGDGEPDPINQRCITNDGTNRTAFIPQFPASCPYVTAVGGTIRIPEIAYDLSGGGFSRYFSRPSYQEVAVKRYLEKLAPGTYDGLYNPNGRAIPDVAAIARKYQIIYQGNTIDSVGTAPATCVFASFVAMLNDARINAGKFPLGFLNQWLYQKGYAGLNDITVGHNTGCGTDGFNATDGWDPVTGLGTPDLKKLLPLAAGNHY